ncbi:MAG: asparagine synthase (glutamine-hydrolyzing) [Polyangiaceae bacterium]
MCGFAGILDARRASPPADLEQRVRAMRDSLLHRGPDDGGIWADGASGVALGHRRLSIVDLSPAGHQPMFSESRRYVVVFNGEIYNFPELRSELEGTGAHFRGHSDTEVLLASIERWGVPDSLRRFNGMFAFALWDQSERALYLARDRFGEKPLYYAQTDAGDLLFGSELKALLAHPEYNPSVDRDSLVEFVRHTYVPSPGSIFRGTRKLPAATYLRLTRPRDIQATPQRYWSMQEVAEQQRARPFQGSVLDAVTQLDRILRAAVRRRMVADVSLGAFLSGGIDSSTIVAMMQLESSRPVKTFSIGFFEEKYNEARYAKAVARHLGTEHTEHYVTAQEALDVIPRLPQMFDEPFADSSQIPTFLVAQLARRDVTVALSGDAGDELFGGYSRYSVTRDTWRAMSRFPRKLRGALAFAMARAPAGAPDRILRALTRHRLSRERLRAISQVFGARDVDELYARFMASSHEAASVVVGATNVPDPVLRQMRASPRLSDVERMMLTDTLAYLPDDILAKVDRASMAVSLEVRVPLLDPAIAAFAWALPEAMKLHDGTGKRVLRGVLARYVPARLFERPKVGFGIPIDEWLRGPLKEWAENALDERRLRSDGFFSVPQVRERWLEHRSGARNWAGFLWPILVFQGWSDAWRARMQ